MSAWIDWLKVIQLQPRFLFGFWFLGGLILFLPIGIAETLGIQEARIGRFISRGGGFIGGGVGATVFRRADR